MGAFVERDFSSAFLWRVEIEGVAIGDFQESTLPSIEIGVIEYGVGGKKSVQKRPGIVKYGNLKLKRGYSNDRTLQTWWENISKGQVDRRSVSLVQLDEVNTEVMRWNMFNCWPCKWNQSPAKAGDNNIFTEEVEFALEFMERAM